MAKLKSAKKRIRSSEKRRLRNAAVRTRARNTVKKVRDLIAQGNLEEAQKAVVGAISTLDQAASKGILHRNSVARSKSRLLKRLNTALAAAQA